jgi:hypothetical protein
MRILKVKKEDRILQQLWLAEWEAFWLNGNASSVNSTGKSCVSIS